MIDKIIKTFGIEGSTDKIVFLSPDLFLDAATGKGKGLYPNILRITEDGCKVWLAKFPKLFCYTNIYVACNIEQGMLTANTWTGSWVQIDIQTGEILNECFTK